MSIRRVQVSWLHIDGKLEFLCLDKKPAKYFLTVLEAKAKNFQPLRGHEYLNVWTRSIRFKMVKFSSWEVLSSFISWLLGFLPFQGAMVLCHLFTCLFQRSKEVAFQTLCQKNSLLFLLLFPWKPFTSRQEWWKCWDTFKLFVAAAISKSSKELSGESRNWEPCLSREEQPYSKEDFTPLFSFFESIMEIRYIQGYVLNT